MWHVKMSYKVSPSYVEAHRASYQGHEMQEATTTNTRDLKIQILILLNCCPHNVGHSLLICETDTLI